MVALVTLLMILTFSILITRVATIALVHTGLAPQSARFQARSAFTGVGFTTHEAENVVNHPVRRKILMLLMLMGNAGIVSAIASMMLTFVDTDASSDWLVRLVVLVLGVAALWTAAQSQWLDTRLSKLIRRLLKRWTDLDVRDYASLFHLGGDYQIAELRVEEGDWLAGRLLGDLKLRDEGVLVLGIQEPGGTYTGVPDKERQLKVGEILLMYGRGHALHALDQRREGIGGILAHQDAVATEVQVQREERNVES